MFLFFSRFLFVRDAWFSWTWSAGWEEEEWNTDRWWTLINRLSYLSAVSILSPKSVPIWSLFMVDVNEKINENRRERERERERERKITQGKRVHRTYLLKVSLDHSVSLRDVVCKWVNEREGTNLWIFFKKCTIDKLSRNRIPSRYSFCCIVYLYVFLWRNYFFSVVIAFFFVRIVIATTNERILIFFVVIYVGLLFSSVKR